MLPFPGSASTYGEAGIGPSRRGIRGESYWLESQAKPSSRRIGYAQTVSRFKENAALDTRGERDP